MPAQSERQASAEIEVTPEMAAAGGLEIWGNPLMIEGDQCNELAAQVYRCMERARIMAAAAASRARSPAEPSVSPSPGP
jgi:hypothetical protein